MTSPVLVQMPNCPFYGHSIVGLHRRRPHPGYIKIISGHLPLMNSHGNQCALVNDAHSSCYLEVEEGVTPDWQKCKRIERLG